MSESLGSLEKGGNIDREIAKLLGEIDQKYKISKVALEGLLGFKLEKGQEKLSRDSVEFRNALIQEIQKNIDSGDIIVNNEEFLSQKEYEILANKIIKISKLRENIQKEVASLRNELSKNLYLERLFGADKKLLTARFFSKKTLNRANNPQNIGDNLIGFGVGTSETVAIASKFTFDTLEGILKTPYHGTLLLTGKAELDTNIIV